MVISLKVEKYLPIGVKILESDFDFDVKVERKVVVAVVVVGGGGEEEDEGNNEAGKGKYP